MAEVQENTDRPNGVMPQEPSTKAPQASQQAPQEGSEKAKASEETSKGKPEAEPEKKKPAGGFDSTPIPKMPPGYDVRFTFHRATSLPMADINTLSSDPYLIAQLSTGLPVRHKEDPPLRFRSKTIRRNTDPIWEAVWIVAHVPESGFKLKVRLYDEDPADHDDRLGNVHVALNRLSASPSPIHQQSFKIKKRMGSKRAYLVRGCAALFSRNVEMSGRLVVSIDVLGKSEGNGGRAYTLGPQYWSKHFSPLLGRITGTKDGKSSGKTQKYDFQANQFQLRGPVPRELYHRYVEFRPFIKGMFSKTGFRGRILNRALHHQHARIYNYDRTTIYGCIENPDESMSLQFLDMVHYDQGARTWTYIITLDGIMRFTETGKEFGIDMLSKHTMHSDVSAYIAFSGEFLVRRLKLRDRSPNAPGQESHPPKEIEGGPPDADPPHDPKSYELIIDNDSGTYRPKVDLLPSLKKYLERNFPGLKIVVMDGQSDECQDLKKEQRERKKVEGENLSFVQGEQGGNIPSSDEEELADGAGGASRKKANAIKADLAIKKTAVGNLVHGEIGGADGDGADT